MLDKFGNARHVFEMLPGILNKALSASSSELPGSEASRELSILDRFKGLLSDIWEKNSLGLDTDPRRPTITAKAYKTCVGYREKFPIAEISMEGDIRLEEALCAIDGCAAMKEGHIVEISFDDYGAIEFTFVDDDEFPMPGYEWAQFIRFACEAHRVALVLCGDDGVELSIAHMDPLNFYNQNVFNLMDMIDERGFEPFCAIGGYEFDGDISDMVSAGAVLCAPKGGVKR